MRVPRSSRWPTPIQAVICLMVAAVLWRAETVEAQSRRPGARQGPPSVTAAVMTESIARSTEELTFRIAVEIPAGHHGYIDNGDDGFLIPFSFSFPGLEESGTVVEMTSAPLGVRDLEVRAQVLRGSGDFAFRLVPPPQPIGTTADLRYQICNDVTGICYPPMVLHIPVTDGEPGAGSDATPPPPAGARPASLALPWLERRPR